MHFERKKCVCIQKKFVLSCGQVLPVLSLSSWFRGGLLTPSPIRGDEKISRSTSHEGSWPLRAKVIDLHLLIFPTDASRNRWKYDIFRVKVGRCCNLYSVLGWRLFGNSMVGVNKVVFFMVYIPGLEKRGYVLLISPLSMETSWFFF
jgi:hypothetical protein